MDGHMVACLHVCMHTLIDKQMYVCMARTSKTGVLHWCLFTNWTECKYNITCGALYSTFNLPFLLCICQREFLQFFILMMLLYYGDSLLSTLILVFKM